MPQSEKSEIPVLAQTRILPIPKPKIKLVGTDGNVYAIIAKVSNCLKKSGHPDLAKNFAAECFSAKSYDEVLFLCQEYCDVY